jgi:hypothetical protein
VSGGLLLIEAACAPSFVSRAAASSRYPRTCFDRRGDRAGFFLIDTMVMHP